VTDVDDDPCAPARALTKLLLDGSRNESPNPEERRTMERSTRLAYNLDIMLPPCCGQPSHAVNFLMTTTAEQTDARDAWSKAYRSHSDVNRAPESDRFEMAKSLSTMLGTGDPELLSCRDHLTALTVRRQRARTNNVSWEDDDFWACRRTRYGGEIDMRETRFLLTKRAHNLITIAPVSSNTSNESARLYRADLVPGQLVGAFYSVWRQ
jgi:hypothetical protein